MTKAKRSKRKTEVEAPEKPSCLTCGCDDLPIQANLLCARCDALLPGNMLARIAREAAMSPDSPYPTPRFDP